MKRQKFDQRYHYWKKKPENDAAELKVGNLGQNGANTKQQNVHISGIIDIECEYWNFDGKKVWTEKICF